ncbi:MAG TPA: S8 family serine peptidase [Acidobacteriaceae bacterium]|nr:S8 family serine peptidase [Acidobacteriaceae bacterium]
MIPRIIKNALLLTVLAVLSSSLAYAQAAIAPVVPPDSVGPGEFRPYSWVVIPADGSSTLNLVHAPGQPACNAGNPCFYNEGDIWTAYGLPPLQARGHNGQGITIAIVDAFYDPQIAVNLQNFSTFFHLPLGTASTTITCTTTPTFTVVNQTGGSPTGVGFNAGWAEEANLDVQQAHAMAPCANILLIAANNNSNVNLFTGVQYAYAHADLVSNSYGGNEGGGETTFDSFFAGSPVPLLFSSGDTAAVTEYPCASPYATCVGGTNLLTTAASFRTSESVWNDNTGGTGGGCSLGGEPRPAYQNGFTDPICGTARGVPDIAALADPYTGVDIALSTNVGVPSNSVYCCIGGTSLAAPLTAGVLANVDGARVGLGKAKLGLGLNALLYQGAGFSPTGISSQPAPYGSSYRSFYFDVYLGNSGFPATTFWDRTTGLGVPSFASIGNYLIATVP